MSEQKFKTVITSKHKIFDLHIKETLSYKDLIFLFVKRDFVSKYKQTVLGPLWAVIQPLLTTFVFTLIFGTLANLSKKDISEAYIPGFLFYLSGTVCWHYISETVKITSNTFIQNRHLMGKVYYPRLVTPIATSFSNLISFGIQFVMFIVALIVYMIIGGDASGAFTLSITPNLLLLPLVVLQMMLLSTGCGIIISALTTKYRDLIMLVTFGLQLWQYASPVAYGFTLVSDKIPNLIGLYLLNPATPIIMTFRYSMFGTGYFNLTYYLIGWATTLVLFFIGLILFSRIERTFADTV